MKVAILDDEKVFLESFKEKLWEHEHFKKAELNIYTDSKKFLDDFFKEGFDVVFLDVEMPGISGIEIGKTICEKSRQTVIAFVSSYPEYALDAFDCDAVGYIIKGENEFLKNKLDKVYKKYLRRNKTFVLETGKGNVNMLLTDIFYIEYFRKYCIYHTATGDYSVRRTLKNVLDELSEFGFYQVYRCFVVNLQKIKEIRKTEIILQNNVKLTVSRGIYTEIVDAYATYMAGVV